MEIKEKFEEVLGVTFTEDYRNPDLQISTWSTADGYDLYVITDDPRNLNWESDVFYYQPSFDDIMDYIEYFDEGTIVYCDDFDEYFDEYYILDYLQGQMSEEEFDEFTENFDRDES